jgi:hypothetical protein
LSILKRNQIALLTKSTARLIIKPYKLGGTMERENSWSGWVVFAGFLMIIRGVFEGIAGLTALLKDSYYVVSANSLAVFDYTTWGWLHLAAGLFILWAGISLFYGSTWARLVAIFLASVALIGNLLFLPAYPLWSIFAIVVDLIIIYALTVHGDDDLAAA